MLRPRQSFSDEVAALQHRRRVFPIDSNVRKQARVLYQYRASCSLFQGLYAGTMASYKDLCKLHIVLREGYNTHPRFTNKVRWFSLINGTFINFRVMCVQNSKIEHHPTHVTLFLDGFGRFNFDQSSNLVDCLLSTFSNSYFGVWVRAWRSICFNLTTKLFFKSVESFPTITEKPCWWVDELVFNLRGATVKTYPWQLTNKTTIVSP